MQNQTIGFVGAGQMATALARGVVNAGVVGAGQILAFDPFPVATENFQVGIPDCKIAETSSQLATDADIIVLAVKPQVMDGVLSDLRPAISDKSLVVSIAAGVKIDKLAAGLGSERIIRVMPNTPCLVGHGASGFASGPAATEQDISNVNEMLSAVGCAFHVGERLLDAVTGLSGSGPAYIFTIIEALSDGGVQMGLPRNIATELAAHTVRGAAQMVIESGEHSAVLKERVTSPGGTTIAGLQALEDHGLRSAMMAAVESATNRAKELG